MKNFFLKIKTFAIAHKIISAIIIIAVVGGGYGIYKKVSSPAGITRYVVSPATTGTIISSVTDSGQVSALNQVNINPTVSGELTAVYVVPGQHVSAGQALFTIDDTTAEQAVTSAKINLQNADLALQKLQLQDSSTNLSTSLAQSYDSGFTSVSNTFLDLPTITDGITNMFFESTNGTSQQNVDWYAQEVTSAETAEALTYKQDFLDAYALSTAAYKQNATDYQTISRTSTDDQIDSLISETYNTSQLIANTIQAANNYINFVDDTLQKYNFKVPTIITTQEASLNTYTSEINSHLSDLLSAETNISNAKNAIPSDDLDTQSAQIAITQAQNALTDAEQNLAYYHITAPFDGVISTVPVIKGDNVGSGTTLATIITTEELADISMNEVDVAKIALGDQATLTFDAIPNLTIAGKVVEIDSVGTVSQGVVNYNVQISFDTTSNDGVKPGMSVNAAIITSVAQNVLTVPNSAIKTQAGVSYVQVFSTPLPAALPGVQGSPSAVPPTKQIVTIGVSDDTSTQILSGLTEGQEVVTKIITPTTTATTTTPSILSSTTGAGARGGAAGGVRIP